MSGSSNAAMADVLVSVLQPPRRAAIVDRSPSMAMDDRRKW
jgi:hypothetical protein